MRTWFLLAGLLLILAARPVLAQAPPGPNDLYQAGEKAFMAGKYDAAFTDFSLFCNAVPKDDNTDYARLFLWIARSRQHHQTEADTELAEALSSKWNAERKAWVSRIAAFFLGQIGEKELFELAQTPGSETVPQQLCEAWYYAGVKHALAGDKKAAIDSFNKCLATNQTDFTEYAYAYAELKSMDEAVQAPPPVDFTPPDTK